TPVSGGAGANRRRTAAPVRKPTPRTSAGRARVRCGRDESRFTIAASRGRASAGRVGGRPREWAAPRGGGRSARRDGPSRARGLSRLLARGRGRGGRRRRNRVAGVE